MKLGERVEGFAFPAAPGRQDVPLAVAVDVIDGFIAERPMPFDRDAAAADNVQPPPPPPAAPAADAVAPAGGACARRWGVRACGNDLRRPAWPRWNWLGSTVHVALVAAWLVYAVVLTYFTYTYLFAEKSEGVALFCVSQSDLSTKGKVCIIGVGQVTTGVIVFAQAGIGLFFFGQGGIGLLGGCGQGVASIGIVPFAMGCTSTYTYAAMVAWTGFQARASMIGVNTLLPWFTSRSGSARDPGGEVRVAKSALVVMCQRGNVLSCSAR